MRLLKEARQLGFRVEGEAKSHYKVWDGEHQVMRGLFNGVNWITTYSTYYFPRPEY